MTMQGTSRNSETMTMTRRTILGGGIACAVASAIPQNLFAEIAGLKQNRANLYVFPGEQTGTTVIATIWPSPIGHNFHVKVHAGAQSWTVQTMDGTAAGTSWQQDGCRMFAGNVTRYAGAVVVEAPNRMLNGGGAIGVWAERFTETGSRQRAGSPFVAAIVAEDYELARRYHSLSPAEDRAGLLEGIAKAITSRARRSGLVGDPEAHGKRLASRLLPDVLQYNPQLPAGFTFAAQNGRHPADASALIVDTILNGSPAFTSEVGSTQLQIQFPYFSQV
jgi:hypothetical protein